MAATAADDEDYRIVSTAVDQAFYRTVYPDAASPELDPVRDYLDHGWREGRDPAPWFSVRAYLAANADVVRTGEEPLAHYLRHGAREGRRVFASEHAAAWRRPGDEPPGAFGAPLAPAAPGAPPKAEAVRRPLFTEDERRIASAEFDAGFYARTNPHLADKGLDLLEHFLAHGWREGLDPCAQFSVRDYLENNPDIARAGVNPFTHYIATGRAEGRPPRSTLGFRHKIITGLQPLEARIAWSREAGRTVATRPATALAEAFAQGPTGLARTGLRDLHLTFSHDDYTANVGGVQLCLQYEAERMAARGRDHLHLFPARPWPVLRRQERAPLGVLLNGRALGAFEADALCEALAAAGASRPGARSLAIHNLLGHDVEEVIRIAAACSLGAGVFWLHDFTSLCAGYQLLRNDVEDCAAPPIDSAGCGICLYGPARGPQLAEHERLFRRLALTVVSPSKPALDFWLARARFPAARTLVHPHVRLVRRAPARIGEPGPLRLAFLGMPSPHKGWPIFARLATDHAADPRYRFLHLGARPDPRAPVEFHEVSVSLADRLAMQRTIEALEVDVAVIWSLFRETFCLAAHEAVAAGAAVVTGPDSLNVAAFVESSGCGRVLDGEQALARALAEGGLLDLARAGRRPWLHDLEFSGMTADLLEPSVAA